MQRLSTVLLLSLSPLWIWSCRPRSSVTSTKDIDARYGATLGQGGVVFFDQATGLVKYRECPSDLPPGTGKQSLSRADCSLAPQDQRIVQADLTQEQFKNAMAAKLACVPIRPLQQQQFLLKQQLASNTSDTAAVQAQIDQLSGATTPAQTNQLAAFNQQKAELLNERQQLPKQLVQLGEQIDTEERKIQQMTQVFAHLVPGQDLVVIDPTQSGGQDNPDYDVVMAPFMVAAASVSPTSFVTLAMVLPAGQAPSTVTPTPVTPQPVTPVTPPVVTNVTPPVVTPPVVTPPVVTPPVVTPVTPPNNGGGIDFASQINPIVQKGCAAAASCHVVNSKRRVIFINSPQNMLSKAGDTADGDLGIISRLNSGPNDDGHMPMPPGVISDAERQLIINFLNQNKKS